MNFYVLNERQIIGSGKNYRIPIMELLKSLKRIYYISFKIKKRNYVHKKKTLESGIYMTKKVIIILLKRVCDLKFMIYIKYQSFVQNNRYSEFFVPQCINCVQVNGVLP